MEFSHVYHSRYWDRVASAGGCDQAPLSSSDHREASTEWRWKETNHLPRETGGLCTPISTRIAAIQFKASLRTSCLPYHRTQPSLSRTNHSCSKGSRGYSVSGKSGFCARSSWDPEATTARTTTIWNGPNLEGSFQLADCCTYAVVQVLPPQAAWAGEKKGIWVEDHWGWAWLLQYHWDAHKWWAWPVCSGGFQEISWPSARQACTAISVSNLQWDSWYSLLAEVQEASSF